ncbi:Nn.00g107590.m01.CDS01 [Neocucurbitaria sp. VM-36]
MCNPFPLTFSVTLLALSVSVVQSRVVPPPSVSPAQSSEPSPLRTSSNNILFSPSFYEFLKSGSVSTEGNNPDPRPSVWVALGDSFAAGPGAGDELQDGANCVRGSMNYPLQMQADANIPGPNGRNGQKPIFTLKACTGDVTTDLTNQQNPNYQLGDVRRDTSFVTLSIGGNDIKFVDILKKCVFGFPPVIGGPSCDALLKISRDILFGQEFYDHYNDVIIGILSNMDWENRGSSRTAIYQTSYSQFFDSYTDQCDSTSFYVIDFIGPKITKDLRIKLNRLTHEVNYVISYYADLLNVQYSRPVGNPSLFSAAVSFVDVDISYNGHRFCRQGVQEPEHHNTDTHFFNLNLLASTDGKTVTVSGTNMTIPRENATAGWIDANYGDGVHASWAWVMKTFHPTPAGFTHTKDMITYPKLQFREAMRFWGSTSSRDVDLVVLGDYVAFASQDPNSAIYQGIIPHLKAIFRNYRYYNMPPGSGVHVRPTFSGSQKPQNANSEFHECYKIATIDELHDNFVGSPDFSTRNKVTF